MRPELMVPLQKKNEKKKTKCGCPAYMGNTLALAGYTGEPFVWANDNQKDVSNRFFQFPDVT